MKIGIGSDHAGYLYKERIKEYLVEKGHEVVDYGTDSTESVDYPDFIRPVAVAVAAQDVERGIVLGGSGNGEAIVANRIPGVRCTLCWDATSAELARRHNNSNVLSLGERMVDEATMLEIIRIWLDTDFDGGRHQRRIDKIDSPKS